jgi:uncharacterized membrane protein HdeD (DUF308 family)
MGFLYALLGIVHLIASLFFVMDGETTGALMQAFGGIFWIIAGCVRDQFNL